MKYAFFIVSCIAIGFLILMIGREEANKKAANSTDASVVKPEINYLQAVLGLIVVLLSLFGIYYAVKVLMLS